MHIHYVSTGQGVSYCTYLFITISWGRGTCIRVDPPVHSHFQYLTRYGKTGEVRSSACLISHDSSIHRHSTVEYSTVLFEWSHAKTPGCAGSWHETLTTCIRYYIPYFISTAWYLHYLCKLEKTVTSQHKFSFLNLFVRQ